jgi:predicted 3-demethylubiquinone-9 3-methyltransferase (glyoxalase superfamily)
LYHAFKIIGHVVLFYFYRCLNLQNNRRTPLVPEVQIHGLYIWFAEQRIKLPLKNIVMENTLTSGTKKLETKKITPFLWFNDNAEEAIRFYTSVFKNSSIGTFTRYTDAGPGTKGSVMTATFELEGQQFVALNGGPHFKFTEAISFVVNCDNQEEIDWFWERLSEGSEKGQCGWLKDKFGLSWQIVPYNIAALLQVPDPGKAKRVVQALMKMAKIDIAGLKDA